MRTDLDALGVFSLAKRITMECNDEEEPCKHRPKCWKKRLFIVLGVSAMLVILLIPLWLPRIGTFLIVSDPLRKSDALVILAGDEDARLAYGAQLFEQGMADKYVVTNMRVDNTNPQRTYAFLVKRKATRLGVPESAIMTVPEVVATTYEEAVAVRRFAEQHALQSLTFITSPYHTRRARWIIGDVFDGSGIEIAIQPVEDHSYDAKHWWRTSQGRRWTVLEYGKIIAHALGCKHADC